MAFEDMNDVVEKLACENPVLETSDFYVANNGEISNGVALFKDEELTTIVDDALYVLESDTTIFRTVGGLVEILQEGE